MPHTAPARPASASSPSSASRSATSASTASAAVSVRPPGRLRHGVRRRASPTCCAVGGQQQRLDVGRPDVQADDVIGHPAAHRDQVGRPVPAGRGRPAPGRRRSSVQSPKPAGTAQAWPGGQLDRAAGAGQRAVAVQHDQRGEPGRHPARPAPTRSTRKNGSAGSTRQDAGPGPSRSDVADQLAQPLRRPAAGGSTAPIAVSKPSPRCESVAGLGGHRPLQQDREVGRLLGLQHEHARADGVHGAGRHQDPVAAVHLDAVHPLEHPVAVLGVPARGQLVGVDVLASSPGSTAASRVGVEHEPGLGLAVRAAQVAAGELAVRVHVHRQPLAGVEQLDQHPGVARGEPAGAPRPTQPAGSAATRSRSSSPSDRAGQPDVAARRTG